MFREKVLSWVRQVMMGIVRVVLVPITTVIGVAFYSVAVLIMLIPVFFVVAIEAPMVVPAFIVALITDQWPEWMRWKMSRYFWGITEKIIDGVLRIAEKPIEASCEIR